MDVAPRQAQDQPKRPSFWSLLLTNFQLRVTLLLLLLFALARFFSPFGTDTGSTVLGSLGLLFTAFQIWLLFVLSRRGIVAPGSLVGEQTAGSEVGRAHMATYHFAFEDQNLTCRRFYYLKRSVRHDVLVLFDPKSPRSAYILPGRLGMARTSEASLPQYSPHGRWQWSGTQWVPADTLNSAAAPRDSLATASLVLAVTSWIAGCGGFGVLAANPNVLGGIAWQAPSPLFALAAVVTASISMRSSAKAHTRVRGFAMAGLVIGVVSVLLNVGYWIFAAAIVCIEGHLGCARAI